MGVEFFMAVLVKIDARDMMNGKNSFMRVGELVEFDTPIVLLATNTWLPTIIPRERLSAPCVYLLHDLFICRRRDTASEGMSTLSWRG